jgi:osmoprotectant transport system permease protein
VRLLLSSFKPLRGPAILLGVFLAGAWFWASGLGPSLMSYRPDIAYLGVQHVILVLWSGGLAILVGLPAGAILSRPRFRRASETVLQVFNLGTTIPTLAVLALSMSLLGIGTPPAVFGLFVATLLPIVRNTHAGLSAVDHSLIDAAQGMGMTPSQTFFRVELPNALFVIFAGLRTALAICVGTAPLAFLIGAGGLGELIFTGIALYDQGMMLAGAIAVAALAIFTDFLVGRLQWALVPRGVNPLR